MFFLLRHLPNFTYKTNWNRSFKHIKIQKDSSQVKQTNHQTDVTDDNEMDEVGVEEMDEIIKVNEDILKVKNDEIEKLNTDNDILTKELNRIKRILPAMSKEIDRLRSKQ